MRTARSGRLATFVALILLSTALAGCVDGSQSGPSSGESATSQEASTCARSGWTTFDHSSGGFSLCHPDDWAVKEEVMGAKVALVPGTETDEGDFAANMNVYTEQIPEGTDLDTYVDAARQQVQRLVTGVEFESSRTLAAEPPTHEIVYTGQQGVYELRWQQRIVLQDDTAYVLTYTADPAEEGPPSAETVDAVFGSFEAS